MRNRTFCIVWLMLFSVCNAAPLPKPPATLPFGLGVNIHFTRPRAGEMEQLASAGFTFIRMDFDWIRTEKVRGEYDWSEYDALLDALQPHNIRAVFILDYANPLYDDNRSPDTDAGRKAFAKWAAAGVAHFKGRGVLWEMYNEPNIFPFWRPKPNPDDYVKLALETGKAIREVAPAEIYVGPACSGVDFPFLETCFKGGLLEYFSAITVHPYRQHPPETVADDYRRLRLLIDKYAPPGKSIPIYSGEWGYSSAWSGMTEEKQGAILPRQWLTNIAGDVPLSIWYDWHDDGPDPKEPEHHFGTVHLDYSPKPAYLAVKKLTSDLAGYRFNKRIYLARDDDHVLLFTSGQEAKLAAWTIANEPHDIAIPEILDKPIPLSADPQYLTLTRSDALAKLIAWERAPLEQVVKAPADVVGKSISRGQETFALDRPSPISDKIRQRTTIVVANPLSASVSLRQDRDLRVEIANPSGEPFVGEVRVAEHPGIKAPLRLSSGETQASVALEFPLQSSEPRASVELLDDAHKIVLRTPAHRFVAVPLLLDNFKVVSEGDEKVKSAESLAAVEGSPGTLAITYEFQPGWKYACLKPANNSAAKIDGKPRAIGMWVVGDNSGNLLRMRFTDSTGQTFQPDGPKLTWSDYRYVTFPLDASKGGHWGGANDGVIHYPIRLETLLLIDSADRGRTGGTVKIDSPTLVYEEPK